MAIVIKLTKELEERFWAKVKKTKACWEWVGAKNEGGYGVMSRGRVNNSALLLRAHRVAWLIHNGELPEDLHVCHHCDNPACVNPTHLFLGTDGDNIRDMWRKGYGSPPPVRFGSDNNKTKLTKNQVIEIRSKYEQGRIARRMRDKSNCSFNGLAKEYSVSKKTILNIIHRRVWKWV